MASRSLDDLTVAFRGIAEHVLEVWLAKYPDDPLIVTFTLRTQAEQDMAVSLGRSETHHGPHLPHAPDGKSWALDVVPKSLMGLHNYAPADPLWWELGALALSFGLRWGGKWEHPMPEVGKVPNYFFDPGHIEWSVPKTVN